ncbi:MAG: hypothetical protein H7144_04850 [Burkholderiales bacterium]|nr:hypothetical protein [Phycisphaerae bacterium]
MDRDQLRQLAAGKAARAAEQVAADLAELTNSPAAAKYDALFDPLRQSADLLTRIADRLERPGEASKETSP